MESFSFVFAAYLWKPKTCRYMEHFLVSAARVFGDLGTVRFVPGAMQGLFMEDE